MYICEKCHAIYDMRFEKKENDMYDRRIDLISSKHCDHNGMPCSECETHLVKIDSEILPMLVSLWDKGYKTMFSCSGHAYNGKNSKYGSVGLNTYIMIYAELFTEEFTSKILELANDYRNLTKTEVSYSVLNNIRTKCITLSIDRKNPRIYDHIKNTQGYMCVPLATATMALEEYSLLCEVRNEMANIVAKLPRVTINDLIKSESQAPLTTLCDYDLDYDELWVEKTITRYPEARRDVLVFISAVNKYGGEITIDGIRSPIESLFASGFCYYFALMLHDAFGGEIVWHNEFAHILWMDENKVVYDIYGVLDDYVPEDMVPISKMDKDFLETFRHRQIIESRADVDI